MHEGFNLIAGDKPDLGGSCVPVDCQGGGVLTDGRVTGLQLLEIAEEAEETHNRVMGAVRVPAKCEELLLPILSILLETPSAE